MPSRFACSVVVAVAFLGGCGRGSPGHARASYSACRASGEPTACLGFLDRAARVTSIRLTASVPPRVTASCAAAARMTRLRIVCPPLVPAGGVVSDHDLYGPQIVNAGSYSVSINNGQNPGRIHWEFGAIRGPQTRLWVFDRSSWDAPPGAPPARLIAKRNFLG